MKKIMITLTLVMMNSWAVAGVNCSENGCSGNINEMVNDFYLSSFSDGRLLINLNTTVDTSNLGCELYEGKYITVMKDHPLFDAIYSSLLSAVAMDKSVQIRTKNGTDNCDTYYIRFYL